MSAIVLWVRATLRHRWVATIGLALLIAVAAGLVGASMQAARRAAGAVDRHTEHSRLFDVSAQGCPSGVNPDEMTLEELNELCISSEAVGRLRDEVLRGLPEVESTATAGTMVAGVLDPSSGNGWGRLILIFGIVSMDDPSLLGNEIVVEGRYADPAATDELMISEAAAQAAGIHAGDVIQVTSWPQEQLDAAADGRVPPTAPIVPSRVVGVIRTVTDLQRNDSSAINDSVLPDSLLALPGWVHAHGDGVAAYGYGALLRLRNGPDGIDELAAEIEAGSRGWTIATDTSSDADIPALQHVIDAERQAVVIFAIIASIAGCVLVGLTLARQLRRELAHSRTMAALGQTRSMLVGATVLRSMVIAGGAVVMALAIVVVLSPLGPLGTARKMEYSHPFRVDWVVLAGVTAAIVALVGAIAAGTAAIGAADTSRRVPKPVRSPRSGPVSSAALVLVRGSSPRVAAAVSGIAVATAVAAATLVLNVDAVLHHPARFGAWWDVAVGQYSNAEALADGEARVTANSMVTAAASMLDEPAVASLDGTTVPLVALVPLVGDPEMLMASGRAPIDDDEVALGADTARALGTSIGDTVRVTSNRVADVDVLATVTGIAVMNNPVRAGANAGQGVVMPPALALQVIGETVAQSILIEFAADVDRAAAIDSIVADFPSSTRLATPQADLADLTRLRAVPWLIAAVIGALALAALVHAMVTLFNRRVRMLAVLAALGLTAGQRRRVGLLGGLVVVGVGLLIGVPCGLVLGRWIWDVVARRISIPAVPRYAWGGALTVALVGMAITACVVWVSSWRANRVAPAVGLRVE